ncbi:MAG: DUF547 domain-containing protein [Bacteroidota bacterium]
MIIKLLKLGLGGILLLVLALFGYAKLTNKNFSELALVILSSIKSWSGQEVAWQQLSRVERPLLDHDLWDQLLQSYVDLEGNVDYEGMRDNQGQLKDYLQQLSTSPPGNNWSEADALAYWINAYNAFTVQLILDHYPLASIKDISAGLPMINSPWDIKFFQIEGIDFDLNTIEHAILRKQFSEPRIHFAINCASFSCPRLRNEAYTADRLEAQLKDQTLYFLNNSDKNLIGTNQVQLSQIFNWFTGDFTQDRSLIEYLKTHTSIPIQEKAKISFLEYQWQLNKK